MVCATTLSFSPDASLPPPGPWHISQQVLHHSGVGSGCSYTIGTPLPIPITYPLLFRESLGLRGELLSTPPPPSQRGSGDTSSLMAMAGGARGQGVSPTGATTAAGGAGEFRVMCDQISGVAYAERDSDMGSFIGQVRHCVLCVGLRPCGGAAGRS